MVQGLPIRACLALLVTFSDPASAAGCELHVWPAAATDSSSGGWLSNLGLVGAIADYERNKDGNLRDQLALIEGLPPPRQAQLLAELDLPMLLGMPGARILFESGPLNRRSAAKSSARSSASTATCYAELILMLNRYDRSALHGRTLTTSLVFKDYRGGKPRISSARIGHAVPHFPPATAEHAVVAQTELSSAFAENVRTFAARVDKSGGRESSPVKPGEDRLRTGP